MGEQWLVKKNLVRIIISPYKNEVATDFDNEQNFTSAS